MALKRRNKVNAAFSMSSMTDIVFLLLIFFMVSTTFEHQSRIQIELPEATASPEEIEEESIEIVIDAQGRYFIGEEQVVNTELKTLKSALSKVVGDRGTVPVTIRADASTPHQAVITALDATSQLGLTQISLATSRIEE